MSMADGRSGGLIRLPPTLPGMRIGLYGGSFDPPHAGHRHVALLALKRLGLDRVWWIVGPGNPLKDRSHLPSVAERVEATRAMARHPRMIVTDFEATLGAHYTVETVRYLVRRCPTVDFVYILGADSFANFHHWRAWREIASLVPIAVVDRPRWTLRALRSRAAAALDTGAMTQDGRVGPGWTFIEGPRSALSSTALRDKLTTAHGRR
jgi:nicotinate-nucleotide adenylyltransferase